MNREMDMAEVSDGKLYGLDDMVKADCAGCEGCHACCTGMGTSVVLDPFDAYRMTAGTGKTFEALLAGPLELNVVDGIILPNLKMAGEEEACSFLDQNGRCRIHAYRPGILPVDALLLHKAMPEINFCRIIQETSAIRAVFLLQRLFPENPEIRFQICTSDLLVTPLCPRQIFQQAQQVRIFFFSSVD